MMIMALGADRQPHRYPPVASTQSPVHRHSSSSAFCVSAVLCVFWRWDPLGIIPGPIGREIIW